MYQNEVRIFDYPPFAGPFKETIRANAERVAKKHDIEIEFVRKPDIRKESIISGKIKKRGAHPGIVILTFICFLGKLTGTYRFLATPS
jgi:hypothetical protein